MEVVQAVQDVKQAPNEHLPPIPVLLNRYEVPREPLQIEIATSHQFSARLERHDCVEWVLVEEVANRVFARHVSPLPQLNPQVLVLGHADTQLVVLCRIDMSTAGSGRCLGVLGAPVELLVKALLIVAELRAFLRWLNTGRELGRRPEIAVSDWTQLAVDFDEVLVEASPIVEAVVCKNLVLQSWLLP